MKFHHVGVLVQELDQGRKVLESISPSLLWSEVIEDPTIGVKVQFGLENSGLRYELVAPFGVESPITNYLEKNGNMFHHIAYQVANFNMKCCELRKLGWVPLGEPKPAVAFSGKRVAFFLSPTRLIFELIEDSIQTNGNESQNE